MNNYLKSVKLNVLSEFTVILDIVSVHIPGIFSILLLLFLLLVSMIFGIVLGDWYYKEYNHTKLVSIIAGSNVITWLIIPALGIFTASATYIFSYFETGSRRSKYTYLWMIGGTLAIGNVVFGILMRMLK